jgi:hypothetical protein
MSNDNPKFLKNKIKELEKEIKVMRNKLKKYEKCEEGPRTKVVLNNGNNIKCKECGSSDLYNINTPSFKVVGCRKCTWSKKM